MLKTRHLAIGFAIAVLASLLGLTTTVGATPASDVQIEVPGFEGPFIATGPAVDDGVVCGSGVVVTTFNRAAGFQSGSAVSLAVGKEFTCDDASGTFSAKLQVRVYFEVGATFRWVITGGTGKYADLHGTGSGFVVGGDTDVYQGGMHID